MSYEEEIAELESKIADLEKRNEDLTHRLGKEQVVTMQNREIQLQKYIGELEKNIERLHLVIDSCHEDLNCKSDKIDELDVCHDEAEKLIKKNADQINSLLTQVAALKEIALEGWAVAEFGGEQEGQDYHLYFREWNIDRESYRKEALELLQAEHPEAFR